MFDFQSVYMHTSLTDPGILMVFEVIATGTVANDHKTEVSCGWGYRRLFKQDTKLTDLSDGKPAPAAK